jgi:hypothetical protein
LYHYEDEAFYIIAGEMTFYETLDTPKVLGPLPEQVSVHLGHGHDSEATR